MVIVGYRDARAGSHIIVGIKVEEANGPCVVVALQMTPNLVVAISYPVRKEAAFGIQKQAG